MSITQAVRRLASRTVGVASDEVGGHTVHAVNRVCQKLVVAGHLHRAKTGPHSVRYFSNPVFRDAYMLHVDQENRERTAAARAARANGMHRAPWADGTPAIVPAHVQVQVCPPFELRFESVELPGLYGGNQRGRMLEGARAGVAL